MEKKQSYHESKNIDNTVKLRVLIKDLPPYVKDYFRAKEATTSVRTRISYAYDLRVFFHFLQKQNPSLGDKDVIAITLSDLNNITSSDIEEYQEYLKYYHVDGDIHQKNSAAAIARKISSLRSFLDYYHKKQQLDSNPALLVDMPKIHEKAIIHLEPDEIAILLDSIESYGDTLSGHKKAYYEKTKTRDLAIVTLLLGTGIRVSECVGLDLHDLNFNDNSLRVVRKGGNEEILFFGREVEIALRKYITGARAEVKALAGHKDALFYSLQKKRLGVDATEDLVKKYAIEFIPQKKITPHKLRSSYGTALYHETGDIYLVADVLGHKDINTTRKHYASMDERRRMAASAVKLRES